MGLYKVEAVVIRTMNYGEADKIVTLYSRQCGKIDAIAKGARKLKSRKRGGVQLFTYGDFLLYKGRSLDTITQCEAKESFASLREDLDKMAYAAYFAELINGFGVEGEANPELLYLLLACYHLLAGDINPRLVARFFEIRLMNIMGYRPRLKTCVSCGNVSDDGGKFSFRLGGVLCPQCSSQDPTALDCTRGSLAILRQLLTMDIRKLRVLKLSSGNHEELKEILKAYIGFHLEKRIKTLEFLESIPNL